MTETINHTKEKTTPFKKSCMVYDCEQSLQITGGHTLVLSLIVLAHQIASGQPCGGMGWVY